MVVLQNSVTLNNIVFMKLQSINSGNECWHSVRLSPFHLIPWDADSRSSSQIPHILWNPKVHYHVHKTPSVVPVLSHMNPVHILICYFYKVHCSILPSISGSSGSPKWYLPFRLSGENSIHISLSLPCSAHHILLDIFTIISDDK
jgi:hypothetical protein